MIVHDILTVIYKSIMAHRKLWTSEVTPMVSRKIKSSNNLSPFMAPINGLLLHHK